MGMTAEIGILGMNNDPLLCENSEPKRSSVQPDFIGEGRLAAELLRVMMSGGKIPSEKRLRLVGIRTLVHRESTVPPPKSPEENQRLTDEIGD
jgi:DNA-binding LacI/PurR family transcriptional regulator